MKKGRVLLLVYLKYSLIKRTWVHHQKFLSEDTTQTGIFYFSFTKDQRGGGSPPNECCIEGNISDMIWYKKLFRKELCLKKMRARMHNVLCYLKQWDFKVYLMCHVHWLNTKYMVAIPNHHLLYWFVSSGTVIKKAIDLLSLFAFGLFINFTCCFQFLDYNFYVVFSL